PCAARAREGPVRSPCRRLLAWMAAAALVAAAACAPKVVPLPAPGPPHYPEYLYPDVPPAVAGAGPVAHHDRGWRFLQAGDLTNAEREFQAALAGASGFYPAQTGLGDVALARRAPKDALGWFAKVLQQNGRYVPALVGQAQAQVALNQDAQALKSYEAALAIDPSLAPVRRQVAVLQFRDLQQTIDEARKAAAAGRYDEALQAYRQALAASPDSPFLYRELGDLEVKRGEQPQALEQFRQAVKLDPSDAHAWEQIGEILEQQGDLGGAVSAFQEANTADPTPARAERLRAAEARAATAKLPAAYRAIPQEARITRADLAALIGVRLAALLQAAPAAGAVLITDARSSWASSWILQVARAGIMPPYPNHTFQPQAGVSRGELATVLSRLLHVLTARDPALARQWAAQHAPIRDVPPQHLSYPAVSIVVASGVMALEPDGTFRLGQAVSGAEALAAIDRLRQLAAEPAVEMGALEPRAVRLGRPGR
ncbi:MAG: tetratricopeptide repeat protein, partial [Acidobacteriota bacterium]|nr:tetratricopeptide repeat protein [Acidobacteriota bacterium]